MGVNVFFFFLAVLFAGAMLVEGVAILGLKKQIIPLPARFLSWLGALAGGDKNNRQQTAVKIAPKGQRNYGRSVLIFGTLILISSLIYLLTVVISN